MASMRKKSKQSQTKGRPEQTKPSRSSDHELNDYARLLKGGKHKRF